MTGTHRRSTSPPPRWADWAALGLVLLVAGVLRLGWPGINSFGFDEARVSLLALQMAREGQVPLAGIPSSAGIANPALFVWLMSLPYLFSRDPLCATLCIALANIAGAGMLWALARRHWGPWAALASGLVYASAPFGAVYSRSIWSQDLMAPLSVLWAWCGLRAVERRSAPDLALHLALAGLAWQVHYSGAALMPVTLWLLVRHRLWELARDAASARRWLAAGILVPILAATPFVASLVRGGEVNAALRTLAEREAQWGTGSFLRWAEVATGRNWEWLLLGQGWRWPVASESAQTIAQGLSGLLQILGLVAIIGSAGRLPRKGPAPDALLVLWALAAPLIFARSSTPVYHQYMLTALPATALLAGRAAHYEGRRWPGPAVAALAIAIALIQGGAAVTAIRANIDALQPGGMGTPLVYPCSAAEALRDGLPVYSHARSDAPEFDADASATSVLFWDYDHRIVNGEVTLLLPPAGEMAHLLFLFPDSPALRLAREHARVLRERVFPRREGEPPYTALEVVGGPPSGLTSGQGQRLDNGLELIGWQTFPEEQRLRLLTCWRVGADFVPGRYHQFNHLYASGDDTPSEVADISPSSAAWQDGSLLLSWVTFEAPARPQYVAIGMYTYPEMDRVTRQGKEGTIRLDLVTP
ncbi:MAG: hypothetical protein GXX94_11745 [Chloroflexi bacterium]|nr:hypothetical protein [Chloroflexota bacterium]